MTHGEKDLRTQAAHWAETMARPHDDSTTLEFMDWRGKTPGNGARYLEQVLLGETLRKLPPPQQSAEELFALAREGFAPEDFVSPAQPAVRGTRVASTEATRRAPRWLWLLAASVFGLAVIAGLMTWYSMRWVEYPAFAESREVRFQDGSTALLFPHSRAKMRVLWTQREYVQEEGGSSLAVAHNSERPLFVLTPRARVQALGTRLNVIRREGLTDVALVSGSIRVFNDRSSVELKPGESTQVSDDGQFDEPRSLQERKNDPQYEMEFHNKTLTDVLREFNRVNATVQFEVRGTAATDKVPYIALNCADPEALIALLDSRPDLSVQKRAGLVTIAPRR